MYIVLKKVLVRWTMTHGLVDKHFPPWSVWIQDTLKRYER
jgi:hypothetical protein